MRLKVHALIVLWTIWNETWPSGKCSSLQLNRTKSGKRRNSNLSLIYVSVVYDDIGCSFLEISCNVFESKIDKMRGRSHFHLIFKRVHNIRRRSLQLFKCGWISISLFTREIFDRKHASHENMMKCENQKFSMDSYIFLLVCYVLIDSSKLLSSSTDYHIYEKKLLIKRERNRLDLNSENKFHRFKAILWRNEIIVFLIDVFSLN